MLLDMKIRRRGVDSSIVDPQMTVVCFALALCVCTFQPSDVNDLSSGKLTLLKLLSLCGLSIMRCLRHALRRRVSYHIHLNLAYGSNFLFITYEVSKSCSQIF